jgi:outer membrane protein OmpA-like peptidoglycan-associated protein
MRRRVALQGLAALPTALLAACAADDRMGAELARQPVHVVFFEDDSVALGATALDVVQDAAALARRYPDAPVRVLGFVAPDPQHGALVTLSRARADQVAAELARSGLPRERIQVSGRGATAFADVPVESRRVEIHVGPA